MKCDRIQRLMQTYDDLSSQEQHALSAHLADCAVCAAAWQRKEETTRLLHTLAPSTEQPPPRIAHRIETLIDPKPTLVHLRRPSMVTHNDRSIRRTLIYGITAVCLAFALVLLVSPAARASVIYNVKQIAGATFEEQTEFPAMPTPEGAPEAHDLVYKPLSTTEMQQLPFKTPTWVPAGFELHGVLQDGSPYVQLLWTTDAAAGSMRSIHLMAAPRSAFVFSMPVGPESVEELAVNGQSAALVQGMWNPDTQTWDTSTMNRLSLYWTEADTAYMLDTASDGVTAADLLRIAESLE